MCATCQHAQIINLLFHYFFVCECMHLHYYLRLPLNTKHIRLRFSFLHTVSVLLCYRSLVFAHKIPQHLFFFFDFLVSSIVQTNLFFVCVCKIALSTTKMLIGKAVTRNCVNDIAHSSRFGQCKWISMSSLSNTKCDIDIAIPAAVSKHKSLSIKFLNKDCHHG